jgi:hypothetical protein
LRGCDEPSPGDYPGVVTGAADRRLDSDLLDVLAQRVMVGDGNAKYVQLQSG